MSTPRGFEEEIARLRNRINDILSDSSCVEEPEPMSASGWMPPTDVLENKDDIVVRLDVPGVNPDEIDLSISGDILQIKGERKQEKERDDENYHAIERGFGSFDRRINLPAPVDVESIKASCKNGVLTIRLPKLGVEKTGAVKVNLE